MVPTIQQIRTHAVGFLQVLKAYSVSEFDLNVDDMIFELGTQPTRYYGLGGTERHCGKTVGFMKLCLSSLTKYEVVGYNEYKSLNRYTDISSFETSDWTIWLETLMCHEMAHVVQHMLPFSNSKLKMGESRYMAAGRSRKRLQLVGQFKGLGMSETGHGDFFKVIYAKFRRQFINHKIKPAHKPVKEFNLPEGQLVSRERATAKHPLIGTKFFHRGETFEIKECYPQYRKYPLLGVSTSGKKLRFAPQSVREYLAIMQEREARKMAA